jgi:nucleotide-binding universal stress UspA family protein
MVIRKILLPLIGTPPNESAMVTALMIANLWGANVLALRIRHDRSGSDHVVRSRFEQVAARQDVPVQERYSGPGIASASFIAVTGREEDVVARHARLADLTVVPHPDAGDDISSDTLHAVLFDSGRPVLISPQIEPTAIGTRVCLAWNGTAESAESALSAMPWMQKAEAVRILSAEGYQRHGPAAPELVAYLALHGVKADIEMFQPVRNSVGTGLLRAARLFGCDLLSMGAYSHSRLRQLILGGVTRHVLQNATLPVMMTR